MIKEVSLEDQQAFIELGLLVNNNFDKLFNLESIINSDYDYVFGYYDNFKLVGFIHITKLYENMDINNIVVAGDYRNKGIATNLLNFSISKYSDLAYVFLEVNDKNKAAINLYKKNGFEIIDIRKKYYGLDDALIMKKEV